MLRRVWNRPDRVSVWHAVSPRYQETAAQIRLHAGSGPSAGQARQTPLRPAPARSVHPRPGQRACLQQGPRAICRPRAVIRPRPDQGTAHSRAYLAKAASPRPGRARRAASLHPDGRRFPAGRQAGRPVSPRLRQCATPRVPQGGPPPPWPVPPPEQARAHACIYALLPVCPSPPQGCRSTGLSGPGRHCFVPTRYRQWQARHNIPALAPDNARSWRGGMSRSDLRQTHIPTRARYPDTGRWAHRPPPVPVRAAGPVAQAL